MMSTPAICSEGPAFARHRTLARLGFVPEENVFRRDGVLFRQSGGWLVLETDGQTPPTDPLREPQPQLGLWKWIEIGGHARRVFEIPAALVAADEDEELVAEESQSLDSFLQWALHSAANGIPPNWSPPARAQVESWLPAGALTVQAGALVRQGKLILSPERWALRCSILTEVPADLPEARAQWLRELAADAQSQWRMIRFGFLGESGSEALVAETDFTGAPHSEKLFFTGLDGLKHAVTWLGEAAEILADATVASRALARSPNKQTNRKE